MLSAINKHEGPKNTLRLHCLYRINSQNNIDLDCKTSKIIIQNDNIFKIIFYKHQTLFYPTHLPFSPYFSSVSSWSPVFAFQSWFVILEKPSPNHNRYCLKLLKSIWIQILHAVINYYWNGYYYSYNYYWIYCLIIYYYNGGATQLLEVHRNPSKMALDATRKIIN